MAETADRIERSLLAAADISTKYQRFVSIVDVSKVGSGAAGGIVAGVLENKPTAAGMAARVTVHGVTKVRAGAAITAGDAVMAAAAGFALTVTSGDWIAGQAYTTAASGYLVEVDVFRGGYSNA